MTNKREQTDLRRSGDAHIRGRRVLVLWGEELPDLMSDDRTASLMDGWFSEVNEQWDGAVRLCIVLLRRLVSARTSMSSARRTSA